MKILAIALVFASAVFLSTTIVSAQLKVESTNPANEVTLSQSPESVSVTFNEAVIVPGSTLEVKDNNGQRLDNGQVTLSNEGKTISTAIRPAPKGNVTVHVHGVKATDNQTLDTDFQFMISETAPLPKAGGESLLFGLVGLTLASLALVLKRKFQLVETSEKR